MAAIITYIRIFATAAILLGLAAECRAQGLQGDGFIDDMREARQDLRDLRKSIDASSEESKAWRGRWDLLDRHPDGGKLFDGHRIAAGLQALWLMIVGAYRLAWGLIAALIAVCIARTARDIARTAREASEAVVAWRRTA